MKLKGDHIYIRLLAPEDAEAKLKLELENREFFESFSVTRYPDFYTLLVQQELIDIGIENKRNDKEYNFGIFLNETNELVGTINLFQVMRGPLQNAFVGYSLDRKYNNRGLTTEAVKLITDFAFQELRLHRIEAGVMPHNLASIRVLEKAGYHKEGIARKHVHINGRWEDHQVMAIINPEDE